MDQEDRIVWNRVVARRRKECASLDKLVALQFLSSLPDDAPEGSPSDQLEFALKSAYDLASDPNAQVKDRRVAFEAIQRLRKSLNESLAQHKKLTSARAYSTTVTPVTNAKATTTTAKAANTTTNNSQDRTRLPLAPHVTAPASLPPVSTPRSLGDTSTHSSEPSSVRVSQNAAVSVSPPLPTTTATTGTTVPGQVAANTSKSPILARATVNGTGKGTSASASGSHRTTYTSNSSTTTRDSTTHATTPTTTSPTPLTVAGARKIVSSPPTQNGTTGIDTVGRSFPSAPQPAPAARSITGSQSTQTSTTASGNATRSASKGTQTATATATRPLFTQTSTTATSTVDRCTPNVPQITTGAAAARWQPPTQTATTATGNVRTSTTVPQTATGPGSWGLPTQTTGIGTGKGTRIGDNGRKSPGVLHLATAARSTSISTQSSAAARTAPSTHQIASGAGSGSLTNQGISAAATTSTGRAGSWSQTQQTSTTGTANLGKATPATYQAASWSVPSKTSTTGTGASNAGRAASTAPQTSFGSGGWTIPTKTSTTTTGNIGRTDQVAHPTATDASTWGQATPTPTTGAGSTGRSLPSASSGTFATQQTAIDIHSGTGAKSVSLSANRSSGNAVVSQLNATALANKNRSSSITADLVAAATTTAQVAADSLSESPPGPVSKAKSHLQPTSGVAHPATQQRSDAPPSYQQRSDAVIAIEKANREKTGHSSRSSGQIDTLTVVLPSILEPPNAQNKRRWNDVSSSEDARSDKPLNKDRVQPATANSSGQEPPQKNPRLQEPPATTAMDPTTQVAKAQVVIDFPADTKAIGENRYSYSQTDRPAVRVYFHKHWPTYEMLRGAGRLFEIWEPYWQVEKVVASGVTAPVEKLEWKAKPTTKKDVSNTPRTVASFDVPTLTPIDISKISWGALKAQSTSKAKDGDCVLLLRMLPIRRKPDENKKRANTHLWPIGTFLMINTTPTLIAQRKQASHDPSKWEYLSHPLELSYHIKNPKDPISISMCCQDSTQFFYMVSVCSYKSPLTLKERLLEPNNSFLHNLSMAESSKKAMEYINKNSMISIDDDDNGANSDETGILIFSLVDPVSKVLMKTPVRGQNCKHWQCFDLQSFMEVNAPVSGGRWRCVCCEQFVNYQDLEVCGLTKEALVRFADVASATRDRVEFRADQTMTLLPAPKLRSNKRRPPSGSSASSKQPVKDQQASIPEPIEIIDLD